MKKFYQISYEQKDGVRRGMLWIEAEAPLSSVHELIREAYREPEIEYLFQLLDQHRSIVRPVTEQYTVERAFMENEKIRYVVLRVPVQNYFLKTEQVCMEERTGASIEAEPRCAVPKTGKKMPQKKTVRTENPHNEAAHNETAYHEMAQKKTSRKKGTGTNIGRVVKVTLENTHPPVWRRIILPSQISFADLHDILQIAFGWEDEHPHEFSFSGNYAIDEELEEEINVDDLLKECSWIRYTYDFGDYWQHKIVWEEDLVYKKRHAMVIKARGDHFAEDSGGIYVQGDESARIPMDIEETNAALERRIFSPVQTSADGRKFVDKMIAYISQRKHQKDFLKNIREMLGTAFELYEKQSVQGKEASYRAFLEKERWVGLCDDGVQEYQIIKMESPQKMSDLLEGQQEKELNNYYKYLQIPGERPGDKHALAENIAAFLREHPEYLLYLFEKEEVRELQELSAREDGRIPLPTEKTVIIALAVGFIQLVFEESEKPKRILIRISAELEDWLADLRRIDTEAVYRSLNQFGRRVGLYMRAYGLIDLEAFYSMYCACWKEDITKEEFRRRIYWQLRMGGIVNTGRCSLDEKDYVCDADLDFEQVIRLRSGIPGMTDYAPWSRKKLLLTEKGFGEVCPEWDGYYTALCYWCNYPEEMAREAIVEDYIAVQNGASATDLAELMQERRECSMLDDYVYLWQVVMSVSLCTPLPFLNGYTRIEYMDRPMADLVSTNLFDTEKLSQAVRPERHLYELPWKAQWLMYLCMMARKERSLLKDTVQAAMAVGGTNYEFAYTAAILLYDGGCVSEAGEIAKELERKYTDPSVNALLGRIQDKGREIFEAENFLMPKQVPVRNTAPKIGRNDKCPCGSGKKYKFCCGRNK